MPDQNRNGFMPGANADWHYLDGYSYDPLPYKGKYNGELPWAMEWIFDNIVQYLRDENWNMAAEMMGAVCHFAGDASMPLHSTWDYNPGGHHGDFEGAVDSHIGEISIPSNYVPQELDDVTNTALLTLKDSFSFTKEGSSGGTNLTDLVGSGIYWNDWEKSMVENRVRASIQFTANVWYTAMIQAGLTIQAPTLISPSDGSSTTDNTPTFAWTSVSGTSYYDFQLASDNNFTINAVTAKGLATTSYTPVTPLTNGVWYWHVRTGDNSTDVGLWSQVLHFTVAQATIVREVQVVIDPSSQENVNGGMLAYTVTVKDNGNVLENFQIAKGDNAGWTLSLDNDWLLVPSGENRATKLTVNIPSNATGCTWDNIWVKVTSKDNTEVFDNKSCLAHVTISMGVNISISPGYQENLPGGNLEYTATIKNIGNVADNYSLENFDNENWALTLDNDLLTIPAGENRKTTLRVTIPENAENCTRDNITVTVTSQENAQVSDSASCIAHAGVTAEQFSLHLIAGWNLIGFPVTNADMTPNKLFAGTTFTMYQWVAPYGPYSGPNKDLPVQDNIGYWVKVNQDITTTFSGVRQPSRTMYFVAGWNLVSFPRTSENTTPNKLFAGTTFTMYQWVAPYGPYSGPNKDLPVEDNRSYWVWVSNDKTVTVPL